MNLGTRVAFDENTKNSLQRPLESKRMSRAEDKNEEEEEEICLRLVRCTLMDGLPKE